MHEPKGRERRARLAGRALGLPHLAAGAAGVFLLVFGAAYGTYRAFVPKPDLARAPGHLPLRPDELVSPEELMAAFGELRKDPAAIAFARAFMAKPELKAAVERFQQTNDARRLVAELKRSPQLRELLLEESRKPAFRDLAQRTLAAAPGIEAYLRKAVPGAGVSGSLAQLLPLQRILTAPRPVQTRRAPPSAGAPQAAAGSSGTARSMRREDSKPPAQ